MRLERKVVVVGGDIIRCCNGSTRVIVPGSVAQVKFGTFDYYGTLIDIIVPRTMRMVRRNTFKCDASLASVRLLNRPGVKHSTFRGYPKCGGGSWRA